MDDLISRQAAIEIVDFECGGELIGTAKIITKRLSDLPSAQPEREPGKWIYDGDCYRCNKCGVVYGWWADSQTSNFCPNCGANMQEEEQ